MTADEITAAQCRLGPEWATTVLVAEHAYEGAPIVYRSAPASRLHSVYRHNWRRSARWWALEAQRGYASSEDSRRYAANMRWLVELLDNGVKVIGRRFDEIVKEQSKR